MLTILFYRLILENQPDNFHFGNKSATSPRSSFNSFSVAAIFDLLKSLSGTF